MSSSDLPSDDALRAIASEILARPEYQRFRLWKGPNPLARILESLHFWLKDLGTWQYATLLSGLVLLLAVLLFHIVWSLRAASRVTVAKDSPRKKTETEGLDAEAFRLAEQGYFLDAAHQMQLACIDRLLREGVLELHRHDPNRTLRRRLVASRMSEDLKGTFVSLLERFERRWFRGHGAGESDRELYEQWRSLHGRITSAAQVP